jgi:hypothetical protein
MSDYAPRSIRFVRANLDVAADSCTADVEVATPGPGYFAGAAKGGISEADKLRTVARATADALSEAFDAHNAKVRILSVQVVDSIPHNAVLVTIAASKGARSQTLLGICDRDTHDIAKATALAVLNATNRFLSRR